MDYSAKSKLSLIKPCVEMLCRIPFVVDLPEQSRTLCMKNYVRRRNLFKSCPETKIDNFQDKARKCFVFWLRKYQSLSFVFALLLNEMRIGRSRKAVSQGSVQLGGQVKALESTIKMDRLEFSMSSANFHPHLRLHLAFSGASLKSGMTLENNRLSTTSRCSQFIKHEATRAPCGYLNLLHLRSVVFIKAIKQEHEHPLKGVRRLFIELSSLKVLVDKPQRLMCLRNSSLQFLHRSFPKMHLLALFKTFFVFLFHVFCILSRSCRNTNKDSNKNWGTYLWWCCTALNYVECAGYWNKFHSIIKKCKENLAEMKIFLALREEVFKTGGDKDDVERN